MIKIFDNMVFGIALSTLTYSFGVFLNKKSKNVLVNPMVISVILCLLFLNIFHIDMEIYLKGANFMGSLILPATAAVGLSTYRKLKILKEYAFPIVFGSLVSCIASILAVYTLCKVFKIDEAVAASLVSKSITMAIALEVSAGLGGTKAMTMLAVMVTGTLGSVVCMFLIDILKLKNEVATGVALGSTSHAAGMAMAMEKGETQVAAAGVCIGIAGICTSIIAIFM